MKGFETINQIEILGLNRLTQEYYEYFSMFNVKSLYHDDEFLILTFKNTTFELRYDLHLQALEYTIQDGEYIAIHSTRDKILNILLPESAEEFDVCEIDLVTNKVAVCTESNDPYEFYYEYDVSRTLEDVCEGGVVVARYYQYSIDYVRITAVKRESNEGWINVNFCLKPQQKKLLLEKITNELYDYYNEIN
jgi:hypothetical protein